MTTYTKYTILTFQDTLEHLNETFVNAILIKITQMTTAGKTDGIIDLLDDNHVRRVWLDQDAADEWIQFVASEAELYNVVITDFTIGDNTL